MKNRKLVQLLYITVLCHIGKCGWTKEEIRNMSPQDRPSCHPLPTPSIIQIDTTQRLSDLRSHFRSVGIKGYIIPSVDAHQSEYVSEYDKRRQFISGFSGSQAVAVVLENKAALWTDGRYFLQAEDQMDCNWILMKGRDGTSTTPTITEWLIANLEGQSAAIGVNPFLMSSEEWLRKDKELKTHNLKLARIVDDLIDKIWTTGRPPIPNSDIHSMKYNLTGKFWWDKVVDLQTELGEKNVDALIVTSLDEVAWLTNCRGSDIPYNPVFISYVILNRKTNTTKLYIRDKERKLNSPRDPEISEYDLYEHLNTGYDDCSKSPYVNWCMEVHDYDAILDGVRELNATANRIWISYGCSYAIYGLIDKDKIYQANSPIAMRKSVKNPVEQIGLRNSHIRDAVALIKFMAMLEKEVQDGEYWTEISAATELEKYRREQKFNRGLSFETISSSGYHAAIIHYMPSNKTDKQITANEIYLLDSGGQYIDGTTDVTRTFHFGTPTDFEKKCYTLSLKGHIDLTLFVFPTGLKGRVIDAIARQPLWKKGLQYLHGTGHGIGSYLSVHEGPGSISITMEEKSWEQPFQENMFTSIGPGMISNYHPERKSDEPLSENMFYSIEPGYYEDGKFGIRHENIAQIVKADTMYQFKDMTFLTFDTITMVPYEPHLIDYKLLTKEELDWLNSYHQKVQDTIGPLIQDDPQASQWLKERTGHVDIVSGASLIFCNPITFVLTVFVLHWNAC